MMKMCTPRGHPSGSSQRATPKVAQNAHLGILEDFELSGRMLIYKFLYKIDTSQLLPVIL
jgi:hypothetical protein